MHRSTRFKTFMSVNVNDHCSYDLNCAFLIIEMQQGNPGTKSSVLSSCQIQVTYYATEFVSKRPSGSRQVLVPGQSDSDTLKTSLAKIEMMELSVPK